MAVSAPIAGGLVPVAGSARLIGLRWLISVGLALPGIAVGIGGVLGRRPHFTEAPDPLPFPHLTRFLGEVPGSMWGLLAAGAVIGWLANLMLTAAAVEVLDPDRRPGKIRIWRTLFDCGSRFLFPYLRVSLAALAVLLVGGLLIGAVFERLSEHGRMAGWTGATLMIQLPIVRTGLLLALASATGVFAMWCRVILVADGKRRVRRLWPIVARLWWRRLFSGLLFHWVLSVASVVIGVTVLFAWRQSPGSGSLWFVAWQLVLLLQAFLWHWRLRSCRLVWISADLDDLRACPDAPWGLFSRRGRLPNPPLGDTIQ